MVSNTFARSIGFGGSAAIKGRSTEEGGGASRKPVDNASNGSLKAIPVPGGKGFQERYVSNKGVNCPVTTKDPLSSNRKY